MSEVKLETLLGKTEAQAKQEYVKGLIAGVKNKIILPLLTAGIAKEKLVEALVDRNNNGYNSIIALPGYVLEIEKQKLAEQTNVGVVINYPLGENVLDCTLKDVKYWAKSAVDEICVVLSISDLKFNKCKMTEKILKNLVKISKKKQVGVMFDAYLLNDTELLEVAKKISQYNVGKVYLSTNCEQEYEDREIKAFKSAKKNYELKFVSFNKLNGIEDLQKALSGSDYVMCNNATKLLDEIIAKVTI